MLLAAGLSELSWVSYLLSLSWWQHEKVHTGASIIQTVSCTLCEDDIIVCILWADAAAQKFF